MIPDVNTSHTSHTRKARYKLAKIRASCSHRPALLPLSIWSCLVIEAALLVALYPHCGLLPRPPLSSSAAGAGMKQPAIPQQHTPCQVGSRMRPGWGQDGASCPWGQAWRWGQPAWAELLPEQGAASPPSPPWPAARWTYLQPCSSNQAV